MTSLTMRKDIVGVTIVPSNVRVEWEQPLVPPPVTRLTGSSRGRGVDLEAGGGRIGTQGYDPCPNQ